MGRVRSSSRWPSVVLVLVMWVAGCSDGDERSLPSDLQGTWTGMHEEGPTTLTLTDCVLGEECGRLERVDDNNERCVYELEYRSEDADGFTFATGGGNSFGCAWSSWNDGVMRLSQVTDDTIEIIADGVAWTSTTLRRPGTGT